MVEGFRGSEGMPSEADFYPLPYDDEIREAEQKEQDHAYDEYYHRWASEQMQSIKWPGKEQKN